MLYVWCIVLFVAEKLIKLSEVRSQPNCGICAMHVRGFMY